MKGSPDLQIALMRAGAIGLLIGTLSGSYAQEELPTVSRELTLEVTLTGLPAKDWKLPLSRPRGFKPGTPLVLSGQHSTDADLRQGVAGGLKYILDRQLENGSWTYDQESQLREDGEAKRAAELMSATAELTLNRIIVTTLACLALSAHEELAPGRIRKAVERGITFLLQRVPKTKKKIMDEWTWPFLLQLLAMEHRRIGDAERKTVIQETAQKIVERVLRDQIPGSASVPAAADSSSERPLAAIPDPIHPESLGGYIGVTVDRFNPKGPGILVNSVSKRGAAAEAGILIGDRILQVDGVALTHPDQLDRILDAIPPGTKAFLKILRGTGETPSGPDAHPPGLKNGGWSYQAETGGSISSTTATVLIGLLDARSIGCAVPQDALDRGARFLESCRFADPDTGEVGFVYYRTRGRPFADDLRGSIGRVAACELALFQVSPGPTGRLSAALELFARRRGELDRVRGFPGTHFCPGYQNAAYYFLYSHYYSALAIRSVGDAGLKERTAIAIQEALLRVRHPEGTWTDHDALGELYGTSMALMALGEIKGLNPDAYTNPEKSLESR